MTRDAPDIFAAFDGRFMAMALREAERAFEEGETPAGCVIVEPAVLEPAHDGHPPVFDPDPLNARILGRGRNATEGLKDATAHAEMLALSAAFASKGDWRLGGCRMYATKEPCPMCAGAISLSRIDTIVWGASDPKRGGGSVFGIFGHPGMNHRPATVAGVMEAECLKMFKRFFAERRRAGSRAVPDGAKHDS